MKRWLHLGSVLWLLALAACGPDVIELPSENGLPVVRASWPQRWQRDVPVPIDATASADVDGRLVRISVLFGDGTLEQSDRSGVFEHLYAAAGSYELRVEVEDDEGATAALFGTVVVVDRIDEPACSCELPCVDDALCTLEGCFLRATSGPEPEVEVDSIPAPGDPLACDGA